MTSAEITSSSTVVQVSLYGHARPVAAMNTEITSRVGNCTNEKYSSTATIRGLKECGSYTGSSWEGNLTEVMSWEGGGGLSHLGGS